MINLPKTFDELIKVLPTINSKELFGEGKERERRYRKLVFLCHPDHNPSPEAAAIFTRLNKLYDGIAEPKTTIKSPKRIYTIERSIAIGDIADIHLATYDTKEYLIKIGRIENTHQFLDNERQVLTTLHTAAGDTIYSHYLPLLVESFPAKSRFQKRVNVFVNVEGLFTLERALAAHQHGLSGQHIGWIFRRLLTALGFIHRNGFVHGAVLPCHTLLQPDNHGAKLVGWGQSVPLGSALKIIVNSYKDWYPTEALKKQPWVAGSDIYLAAKCMVYLSGGNPTAETFPTSIPKRMQQFIKSCLLSSVKMRPDDAWALHDEFGDLLKSLYGKPQFHPLVI